MNSLKRSEIILTLVFVFVVVYYFICSVPLVDIDLWDEAYYQSIITYGRGIAWDYGPLYSLWYYLLSFFHRDPLVVHTINACLIYILLAFGTAFFLYRSKRSIAIATSISFFLMTNPLFLLINRRVNFFAILIVLLGLIATTYIKKRTNRIWAITIAFGITFFVRPEMALAFMIGLLWLCYEYFKIKKKNGFYVTVTILVATVVMSLFGESRSFLSFKGKTFERINQGHQNEIVINEDAEWHKRFGDANSTVSAMIYNPGEFFQHLIFNGKNFAGSVFDFFSVNYYQSIVTILLLLIMLITAFQIDRASINEIHMMMLLAIIPTIATSIVLGPMHQYLFIIYFMIIVGGAFVFFNKKPHRYSPYFLLVAFSFFAITFPGRLTSKNMQSFSPIGYYHEGSYVDFLKRNNIKSVELLRSKKSVSNILSANGEYWYYLANCKGVSFIEKVRENSHWSKEYRDSFITFVRHKGIDAIEIDDYMRNQVEKRVRGKFFKEMTAFEQNPSAFGFYAEIVKTTDRIFYFKM